jgi:hypothetical protein
VALFNALRVVMSGKNGGLVIREWLGFSDVPGRFSSKQHGKPD